MAPVRPSRLSSSSRYVKDFSTHQERTGGGQQIRTRPSAAPARLSQAAIRKAKEKGAQEDRRERQSES